MTTFGDYSGLYNLIYREKVYRDEADFVISELCAYKQPIVSILELGCGTGTHASCFAETGRNVYGVDLSPGMLDVARQNLEEAGPCIAERVQFELGDIRTLALDATFDAAVSLFHVMSYQTRDEDLVASIASARRHIAIGSPFLFDFWYGPAVLKSGLMVRRREVEDDSVRVVRVATPTWRRTQSRVDVTYHFAVYDKSTGSKHEFDEVHSMRYFFQTELEEALQRGGFRVAKCAEWLTGREATESSFSAYMVAIAEAAKNSRH